MAIIGFIVPNVFVVLETMETGNFLLWLNPKQTLYAMFHSRISSAFVSDLLFVVLVFFIWTYRQAMRYSMKNIWVIWILTMLFGMAGAFPLFLYMREAQRKKKYSSKKHRTKNLSNDDEA